MSPIRVMGNVDAEVVAALHALAAETGEPPASLALAWLIAKGERPIFGATRAKHIAEAAQAAAITLDSDRIARLEAPYRAKAAVALPYSARNQAETAALPRASA